MARPAPEMLVVKKREYVTKNMLRITLNGENLNEKFLWTPGCYVKLVIPNSEEKPKVRTYTVKSHDPKNKTIEIDFAIHLPAGPATSWAVESNIGDEIAAMGPGRLKVDVSVGDWYLFAADMAALPAAISAIESLKPTAKGYAFLEITNEEDKQDFSIPSGIELTWLMHPKPNQLSKQQLEAIKKIDVLEGKANIFVAGELETIREIKSYINEDSRFDNAHKYVSSYWKIGAKEEEHKKAKMMSR